MMLTAIALALNTAQPLAVSDDLTQRLTDADPVLAASALAQGKDSEAIRLLEAGLQERPDDAAILINLGIAYAQRGDDVRARQYFQAAMTSDDTADLETADGHSTDSKRVARRALAMLDRGEFRPSNRFATRD